jgi:hypothetical protein
MLLRIRDSSEEFVLACVYTELEDVLGRGDVHGVLQTVRVGKSSALKADLHGKSVHLLDKLKDVYSGRLSSQIHLESIGEMD